MKSLFAGIGVSFLVAVAPAQAAPPREIASIIRTDTPYGQGAYRALFMTVYDAQLWTEAPKWSMQAPFALTLCYHMGFSTDDFVSRADREMRRVAPELPPEALKRFEARMSQVFPPVKSGDEITALYQPGKPVEVFHNGQATGDIPSEGFAEPFFGIWLSPNTSAPSLRAKLLRLK